MVLLLTDCWITGGIERVAVVLANALSERGWGVAIAVERVADPALLGRLHGGIPVERFGGPFKARIAALREIIVRRGVTLVVNLRAHQYKKSRIIHCAVRGLDVRVVEALHAAVGFDGALLQARGLRRAWLRWRLRARYRRAYRWCDAFVVLSERVRPELEAFLGMGRLGKVCAIGNPLTLRVEAGEKEHVLLYVGRLCETEKRVSRLLEVWGLLAPAFPDWRLEMVGDGPDRADLEARAKGLPRVAFHGFCDPAPFYAQARIQLLVSDYEGFPLVLAEGMSAGGVPVVLGSYAAVHDLIDGTNGIVVPTPFDAAAFAEVVGHVMASPRLCEALGCHARAIAQRYDEGAVVAEWDALLAGLRGRRADGTMVPKKGG